MPALLYLHKRHCGVMWAVIKYFMHGSMGGCACGSFMLGTTIVVSNQVILFLSLLLPFAIFPPQLVGYSGRARVMVTLVTDTDPPMSHANSLVGKDTCDGRLITEIGVWTNMHAW